MGSARAAEGSGTITDFGIGRAGQKTREGMSEPTADRFAAGVAESLQAFFEGFPGFAETVS